MHKDEYHIGYTNRYIILPKTYAVWDTQTQCWVADTDNEDKGIVSEMADKFNTWNTPSVTPSLTKFKTMQTEFTCGIYTASYVDEYGWRLTANGRIIGGIDTDGALLSFSAGMAIGITTDTLIEIAVLMNNIKRQYKALQNQPI